MTAAMTLVLALQNLIVEDLKSDIFISGFECARLCYSNQTCVSYFYNTDNKNCIPFETMLSYGFHDLDTATAMGYQYFELRKASCDHENGWRFDRATGVCFKVVQSTENWNQAGKACVESKSTLMSPDTPDNVNLLSNIAKYTEQNFWVGGKRINDTLLWASGEEVNTSALGSDCAALNQDCLLLHSEDGICTDICGSQNPFVCVKNEFTVQC